MKTRQLTHARLLEKVVYDPDTGKFTHLGRRRPKVGQFVEFDGEMHKVMTGIRNFIIVTQERWARVAAASWSKS